ncbi:MAG: hypothetical protein U5N26_02975 [Candidatus Marinimicrobia bacterium]|nr:hypothetical protein [Candidatus Neomarinimicrobiota bacterium]
MNDADVWFIRGNDSIVFFEKTQGVYVPRDTNVQIESGSSYDLYVETDNFEPASASETALSPVSWDHGERMVISLRSVGQHKLE